MSPGGTGSGGAGSDGTGPDGTGPDGTAEDVGGHVNPFRVPAEGNPHQALQPWLYPDHDEFYVPVDRTEIAFEEFAAQIGDARGLRTHGRLVVAVGEQGCGKTSLLNRCVAAMADDLAAAGATPVIYDLTFLAQETPPSTSEERMNHVCRGVVDRLALRMRLDPADVAELRGRLSAADDLYDYLSLVLDQLSQDSRDLVLLVLLPPTDLPAEIVRYARLVRPRLVFCAEGSFSPGLGGWQAQLDRSSPAPPIVLTVGLLRQNDGWLFASSRLERHHGATVPSVRRETMDRVVRGPSLTIAGLVRVLLGVYDDLLTRPGPPGEVTFEDIAEYYYVHGLGEGTGT